MGHGQWAGDSNPDMPGAKAHANHQAPRSSLHKAAMRHRLKELEVLREASWSSDERQLPTGRQITSKGLGVGVRQQGFPGGSVVKNLSAMQEMQETWDRTLGSRTGVQSLGLEDALEEEMTTHSSILAWEIPWTESGRLQQSVGSKRVRHDLVTTQSHQTTGGVVFGRKGSMATFKGAAVTQLRLISAVWEQRPQVIKPFSVSKEVGFS